MTLLRINATPDGLFSHDGQDQLPGLIEASHAPTGPTVIMIHGYKYQPNHPTHCPHRKIFGDAGANWPGHLGFSGKDQATGLGVAFGWHARGGLSRAHQRATALGQTLAHLVTMLRAKAPRRAIHVIAHSLGSEIALSALAHLPQGAVQRIILLTGASFESHAQRMIATPAGQSAEVFNITSRENDVFDMAFEHLVPSPQRGDRALGQGLTGRKALNLQLDCLTTLKTLATMGIKIAAPERRICHWSSYTRPGVMTFYDQLLRNPRRLSMTALQTALPEMGAPRWSRLRSAPNITLPLWGIGAPVRSASRWIASRAPLLPARTNTTKGNEPAY